jgi:hypothetical protein
VSLEKYAKQALTRDDSIGWAAPVYLAALARLRREMLIGGIEIGPCECGKMTANQHGGTYCCDECAEVTK